MVVILKVGSHPGPGRGFETSFPGLVLNNSLELCSSLLHRRLRDSTVCVWKETQNLAQFGAVEGCSPPHQSAKLQTLHTPFSFISFCKLGSVLGNGIIGIHQELVLYTRHISLIQRSERHSALIMQIPPQPLWEMKKCSTHTAHYIYCKGRASKRGVGERQRQSYVCILLNSLSQKKKSIACSAESVFEIPR